MEVESGILVDISKIGRSKPTTITCKWLERSKFVSRLEVKAEFLRIRLQHRTGEVE